MFFPLAELSTELTKLTLVQDLAAVMLLAGIFTLVFHYLGWPKVIGYISAGVFMGLPHIKQLVIANESSVNVLANLGVIFLMFTMGLELNIRKLRKIGGIVFPTAIFDLILMLLVGYGIGHHILHWSLLPSLFLGAAICDSSTTLLAKSLEEMGCSKKNFATIIFGTTLSEDIVTIGIMAVLTGLAMTGRFEAAELAKRLLILGLFLTGVMVFGLLILPKFLNKIKRMKDDETLLVIILGICFGISFIAEKMNFSLALGAFLVGAVVSESTVSKRVHEHTGALRSMFSAVFFVTIGLMVDLGQLWHNWHYILLISLAVILCKTFNCTIASFAMGQPHQDAIKTGIGLAQIGDFAYMVALMGMTLTNNAEPYPQMYQIAVGVSVITTLANPFLLKKSAGFTIWLDRKLPSSIQKLLNNYTQFMNRTSKEVTKDYAWPEIKRSLIMYCIDLALLAVVFSVTEYLTELKDLWINMPVIFNKIGNQLLWLCCFLMGLTISVSEFLHVRKMAKLIGKAAVKDYKNESSATSVRHMTMFLVYLIFIMILAIEFISLSTIFTGSWVISLFILAVYFAIGKIFWKRLKPMALENQTSLQMIFYKEEEENNQPENESGDSSIITVPANSGAIGKSLAELRLRNKTGVTVTMIRKKSGQAITSPGPEILLEEDDELHVLATDEQINSANEFLAQTEIPDDSIDNLSQLLEIHVDSCIIPEVSSFCGKSLKASMLRNITGVTVIRLAHADKNIDNPGPDEIFMAGDKVFLLGNNTQLSHAISMLQQ